MCALLQQPITGFLPGGIEQQDPIASLTGEDMDVCRNPRSCFDARQANGFSLQGQKTLQEKELFAKARSGLKLLQPKS